MAEDDLGGLHHGLREGRMRVDRGRVLLLLDTPRAIAYREGMTAEVLATVAELRERLVGIYGNRLSKLIIYGSHARGEAQAGSDIDVLVVLDGPVDPGDEIRRTSPVTAEISLRRDVVLSCVFLSDARYSRERSPFLLNVRREGLAV
jgi:predicted nucleotidyltransferase